MKKFLAFLMALIPGLVKAEAAKLGGEDDLIRQMLFAAQSLKEQVKQMHLDGKPSPLQTIADASNLVDAGKKAEALAMLHGVLNTPQLETRIQLWVWSALRELGEKPDTRAATEVLGVIIEMPSGGGYDTLAAYADGSARYLNFSGAGIFWDKTDDAMVKGLCEKFISTTPPLGSRAKPRTSLSLPKGDAQVTLLTRSGLFVVTSPPESVVGSGASLMIELMKRAQAKKG